MEKLLINKKLLKQLDITMLITAVIISIFGIINIYSVTYLKFGYYYVCLQLLW